MKKNLFYPFFKKRSIIILALFVSIFIISCNKLKDNFDFNKVVVPDWNPEFAVPLVNSTFAISDFFDEETFLFIKTNPDGSLNFVYTSKEAYSQTADAVIHIPNQSFAYQNPLTMPALPPGSSFEISLEFPIHIIAGAPDQQLDSLILKGGNLHIEGQTNLNRDVTALFIKIPEIIHAITGEPLAMEVSLNNPGGGLQNVTFELNIPLNGYKFIFDNNDLSNRNTLNLSCSLEVKGDNNPNLSPYNFNIGGSFNDLEFKLLFGYLGQLNFSITDSLPISLFNKTIGGGIDLGPDAVDLFINVKNSMGLPIKIGTEYFYAYSKINEPNIVDIYFNGAGNPNIFTINSPDISQVGENIETNLNFSSNNFSEAFNIAPDMLYYKFIGQTNPLGDTLASNFIADTSRISLNVKVDMQLFTAISRYIIQDTIDFELNNENEINHILFRINATNGFPFEANVQVYFTDADFIVLDSLITDANNTILPGAPVSGAPDYKVTGPAHKMTDANLTGDRINNIIHAKKIILKAGIATTNEQLVKIYSDYSLQIQLGTIAGLKIENN